MKVYMATTAHGYSPEVPVCVSKTKEGAEFALTDVYPLLKRSIGGYDPGTGNKMDQAYVREVKVIGEDSKRDKKIEYDESGLMKIYVISTAYVNKAGLDYESPWGVATCVEDAMTELFRYYPNLEEAEPGLFLSTVRGTRGFYITTAIRIKESRLVA